MKKRVGILCTLLLILSVFSQAQNLNKLSLSLTPNIIIPVSDSSDTFNIGGGAALKADYNLTFSNPLFARGYFDFSLIPVDQINSSMSIVSLGAGPGISYSPFSQLNIKLSALGGYFVRFFEDNTGGNLFLAAEAETMYKLTPSVELGLGAAYRKFMADPALFDGISIYLNAAWKIGSGSKKGNIKISPDLNPVFPVFYQYYDNNPLGEITIFNSEKGKISDIEVSFYVKQYMDQPGICAQLKDIPKGGMEDVPIYALFTDKTLSITEDSKVSGQITVKYNYLGSIFTTTVPMSILIHHRNAMTWDDDRKAASFVTAKDPMVLNFSKNVASIIQDKNEKAVCEEFSMGMGIFEALSMFGVRYVIDPTTPYIEFSENSLSLDYLQFPNQTLSYKAGDCDDLSILYNALLESIGIETAFITVPGHIYTAFSLDMKPSIAKRMFENPEDLIFHEDEVWIPVEITQIKNDFQTAWKTGAQQWRRYQKDGDAQIYLLHEAWKIYQPVGFPTAATVIELPDNELFAKRYTRELSLIVQAQIKSRVAQLAALIKKNPNDSSPRNSLGVLYAKFGLYSKAETEFLEALKISNNLPSIVNLAHLHLLKNESQKALAYYKSALIQAPDNQRILLGIAKASSSIEDYQAANQALLTIGKKDPALAAEYSYLAIKTESATRAAEIDSFEISEWEE